MIPFEEVTPQARQWIAPLLRQGNSQSADYSFVNLYAWAEAYSLRAAAVAGALVTLTDTDGIWRYSLPLGGDRDAAMDAILEDAAGRGICPVIGSADPEGARDLTLRYPGRVECIPRRDSFDYLYRAEKLASMAGKKLHGKRSHIHQFEAAFPDYTLRPLTEKDGALCLSLHRRWCQEGDGSRAQTGAGETRALERALEHFSLLELEGTVLFAGAEPCAFTLGSFLRPDTVDVHFEKALASYPGAYPMICRGFAAQLLAAHPGVQWLNREDDMGLENLRRSKLSYCPDGMVEKCELRFSCPEAKNI